MEAHIRNEVGKIATSQFNMSPGDLSIDLKPLGAGLNFLSDGYFVTVGDGVRSKKLFVKAPPQSDPVKLQMLEITNPAFSPFQKEVLMYTKVTGDGPQ